MFIVHMFLCGIMNVYVTVLYIVYVEHFAKCTCTCTLYTWPRMLICIRINRLTMDLKSCVCYLGWSWVAVHSTSWRLVWYLLCIHDVSVYFLEPPINQTQLYSLHVTVEMFTVWSQLYTVFTKTEGRVAVANMCSRLVSCQWTCLCEYELGLLL